MQLRLLNRLAGALLGAPDWTSASDALVCSVRECVCAAVQVAPEFVLRAALFARAHLHLRAPTNYVLALAADEPRTRPFLAKYFAPAVPLPSDWTQIPELFWVRLFCCVSRNC